VVFFEVFPKQVGRRAGRVFRRSQGIHAGLFRRHAAFEMVAARTGCDEIVPVRFAAQVARDNVVDRQVVRLPAAVLAGVIIPAEDLLASQFDDGARPFDHLSQADHGWQGKGLRDRVNDPSTVQDQGRFFSQDHVNCPICRGDIDWLKVRV